MVHSGGDFGSKKRRGGEPTVKIRGIEPLAEKEYIKIVLFIVVLGTLLTIQIKSAVLLVGVLMLIGYAYHTTCLTKKEIISVIVLGMVIGLIATMLPYFFALYHTQV